jgi:PKD repeat protein
MKRFPALLRRLCLLAAMLAFFPLAARAQLTPTPDWTVSTPGAVGAMIALDSRNNAYVAGWAPGSTMTLAKISPSGVQQWQRSFDYAGALSKSTWVTVDGAGNAIVTGMIVDTLNAPLGLVVLKYDSAGALLWQDVILSTSSQAVRAVTDIAGNVYVLGILGQPTGTSPVVIKYSQGGLRLWIRLFGNVDYRPDSMALAPGGNVIVTGLWSGGIFGAALDPAGNVIGSNVVTAATEASSVAVGLAGEIYVVGSGSTATTGFGFLVVKHDAAFHELWRNSYQGTGSAKQAAVDSAGNLVVTGYVNTATCPPGQICSQGVVYDWSTIKLGPNGALLWSRTNAPLPGSSSSPNDIPYSMVVGLDDSVYITGVSDARVEYEGASYSLPSTMTIKYAPDGTLLWSANEPAPSVIPLSRLRGIGVKLGTDGGVFVLGELPQTVFRYAQSGIPNQPPIAVASASASTGTAPLAINFSSLGSVDPDGNIASYAWDFGDGQTSTAANPSHTYAAGSYAARLTVIDNLNAISTSAPITITANAPPPAQPTSLTLAKSTVSGGSSTTATVTVSSAAGVTLLLASSNTAVASVPATVVIPVGATRATFTVRTSNVRRDTVVTLTATANGATATARLTVRAR